MYALEDVRALYADYQEQFRQHELARKPGEGIFGLGMGPRDYPCHGQFAQQLEQLLKELAAQQPASGCLSEVLDYIYRAPLELRPAQDAVYWMLLAAHSLTSGLIPLLEAGDASTLAGSYSRAYPRRNRLPAQDKILAALRAQAGGRRKAL